MTSGFEPRRGGGAVATFTGFEADLLRSLASQLVELLRNEVAAPAESDDPLEKLLDFSGPTTEPDDPVLARLFPTAYPDDEEAAGEFRRFTEGSLRDSKARSAVLIIDMLEEAGEGLSVLDRFADHPEPAPLAAAQLACDRRLIGFCDRLGEADLDRRVLSDRGAEGRIPERIGDLLAHLFVHDIHHRGQVHAMLSGTSVAPPQLDEFFLDYDSRRRRDELEALGL